MLGKCQERYMRTEMMCACSGCSCIWGIMQELGKLVLGRARLQEQYSPSRLAAQQDLQLLLTIEQPPWEDEALLHKVQSTGDQG